MASHFRFRFYVVGDAFWHYCSSQFSLVLQFSWVLTIIRGIFGTKSKATKS